MIKTILYKGEKYKRVQDNSISQTFIKVVKTSGIAETMAKLDKYIQQQARFGEWRFLAVHTAAISHGYDRLLDPTEENSKKSIEEYSIRLNAFKKSLQKLYNISLTEFGSGVQDKKYTQQIKNYCNEMLVKTTPVENALKKLKTLV